MDFNMSESGYADTWLEDEYDYGIMAYVRSGN
jgi:hypothetical protein